MSALDYVAFWRAPSSHRRYALMVPHNALVRLGAHIHQKRCNAWLRGQCPSCVRAQNMALWSAGL